MTKREMFNAVINNEITDELIEAFRAELKKMDEKNTARSSKPSKAAIANAAEAQKLLELMSPTAVYTANDIAVLMDYKTEAGLPSTSKATAVVKVLVENGDVKSFETKIPKKGKCKAYQLVVDEVEAEQE